MTFYIIFINLQHKLKRDYATYDQINLILLMVNLKSLDIHHWINAPLQKYFFPSEYNFSGQIVIVCCFVL